MIEIKHKLYNNVSNIEDKIINQFDSKHDNGLTT